MSLNLLSKFGATSGVTDFTTEFWNAFVEEVALALTTLQDKSASFDEARAQFKENAGRERMSRIRELAADMREEENRLFLLRTRAADSSQTLPVAACHPSVSRAKRNR